MLVSAIISQVKFEAKINATTEFDTTLLDIVNEELNSVHQKHNYEENYTDATLSFTAGVAYVALPSNFIRLKSNARISFYNTATPTTYRLLTVASELQTRLTEGSPQYYEIKNARLYVYPYSNVLTTDRSGLIYYKSPATVTTGSTIQDDWAHIIKHKAIARILVMKDSKAAAYYQQLAADKFEESV